MSSAAIVSLRVRASPQRAFEAFTQEIGQWWRPHGLFQITPAGDGELRFVAGENGRLVTTLPNGNEFEIGRITRWEPGACLAFTWRQAAFAPKQETHVVVQFEPVGDETRVIVEHRGWDSIPQEHAARHGFPLNLFQLRLAEHWRALLASMSASVSADGD